MRKIVFLFLIFSVSPGALGQTRNSVKSKDFPIPLNFDVVGQGLDMAPLSLHYDLESSQGRELKLGNLKVSEQNFYFDILPANRLDARLSKVLPKESLRDWVFLFRWPEHLMAEGNLEMISRTGRVLGWMRVDEKAQTLWRNQLDAWRNSLLRAKWSKEEIDKSVIFKFQYGLRNAGPGNSPFWNLQEPFRFCFSYQEGPGQTRLCTPQYEVVRGKNKIEFSLVPMTDAPPRVILRNENGKLADEIDVPLDKPFQFYAELKSGMTFEFVALPQKTRVVDMVLEKSGDFVWLTTESSNAPLMPSTLLNKNEVPGWVEWIGWQQTIGDFRKFWRTKIPLNETVIMLPGIGGGVFQQKMKISQAPREEMRLYSEARTVKGTYVNGPPIRLRKPARVQVSSKQISVEVEDNKEDVTWEFEALKRGEDNRSYLTVTSGEHSFRAYHDIYKSYPREFSARLSTFVGTEGDISQLKMTFLSEFAFNYWFETVLGWKNYYLARQRWGLSLKYFQSLTEMDLIRYKGNLFSNTAELKYRLNPGLWGRDETWGLIGGYQEVKFEVFQAKMLGVGLFWARSMPRLFDKVLSIAFFELLDHPKWVDMEFIYYPSALPDTEGVEGGKITMEPLGNWSLNFHGQLLLRPNFFLEAGFGLKQYNFKRYEFTGVTNANPSGLIGERFNILSSYGSFGVGFKF